ncbi:MAG: SUMF1/EgtB/PvdO family nonheme iron enzyme [Elusimicrobiota bacterium]|jgi:formylglycine-generating enzyme required for sulfatase activity/serine/threonine protein kinase
MMSEPSDRAKKPPPTPEEAETTPGQEPADKPGSGGQGTLTLGPGQGTLALGPGAEAGGPRVAGWRVGEVVDDLYEVASILGEGGFGSVHKVRHLGWHIDLAVKSPREDKVSSRKAMERFVHEANTWVGLGLHPHIVTCYFVRVVGGLPRIFIECLEGGSLKEWLEARRIVDARTALDIAIQIGRAMERSHGAGLVHRDLKPGNCLMTPGGTLKVTDFGLAKLGEEEASEPASELPREAAIAGIREATMTGRLGTPEYMAPEQWSQAGKATAAADVWAFGVILFELMCGARPFAMAQDEPPDAFYCRMLESGWAYKFREDAPPGIRGIAASCLSPEPKKRESRFRVLRERLEAEYAALFKAAYPREPVRDTPLLADALCNQGVSLADLGQPDEAGRLFGRALKQDPTHPASIYNQGVVLMKEGRLTPAELRSRLEVAKRSRPKEWTPSFLLGLVRLAEGDAAAALRDLKAAEEHSRSPLVRRALEAAKAGRAAEPLDLFVCPPMGAEEARMGESSFQVLLARARKETESGAPGLAYKTLMKARSVKGYERDLQALGLQRELSLKGSIKGFRGGWPKAFLEGSEGALAAAVSPDGRRALSGHADGTVRLWDLHDSKRLACFQGHAGPVTAAAFLPDGMEALSGSSDGSLKVWGVISGSCLRTLVGHGGGVTSVFALPDGEAVLSASEDGTLRLWDLEKSACRRTMKAAAGPVTAAALSLDGRTAVSAGPAKAGGARLRQWDPVRGAGVELRVDVGPVSSLAASPDGKAVLLGLSDGSLARWAFGWPAAAGRAACHAKGVRALAFSPDGRAALSGGDDKALKLWELSGPAEISERWVFEGHQEPVLAACFAPDGRHALSGGKDGLRVWELDWEYAFPEPSDWDESARPFTEVFLVRSGLDPSRKKELPPETLAGLLEDLSRRGFGWLKPEGVKAALAGLPLPSQKIERTFRPTPIAEPEAKLGLFKYFFVTLGALGVGASLWVYQALQGRLPTDLGGAVDGRYQATAAFLPDKAADSVDPFKKVLDSDARTDRIALKDWKRALLSEVRSPRPDVAYPEAPAGMALVPAGDFIMGSPRGEGSEDEFPPHPVHLDAFYIDKHEVTNAQYGRCVQAGACRRPDLGECRVHDGRTWIKGEPLADAFKGDDRPVVCVSWEEAQDYCAWAGRHGKRLATEAEWEKAAAGPKGHRFPWGYDAPGAKGVFRMNWGEGRDQGMWGRDGHVFTAPVGSFPAGASEYGVFDMAGNAAEWVADWYDPQYYRGSPRHAPKGPKTGQYRVLRGGAWILNAELCRAQSRGTLAAGVPMDYAGIRCAASAAVKGRGTP